MYSKFSIKHFGKLTSPQVCDLTDQYHELAC